MNSDSDNLGALATHVYFTCLNQNLQNYKIYRIEKQTRLSVEKDKLTFDIIECALKVHNTLGNGFTHGEFIFIK